METAATKKAEIAVSDFSKKLLDVAICYKGKPKTVSFFNERVKALLTYEPSAMHCFRSWTRSWWRTSSNGAPQRPSVAESAGRIEGR
jgi:hypothetical protein